MQRNYVPKLWNNTHVENVAGLMMVKIRWSKLKMPRRSCNTGRQRFFSHTTQWTFGTHCTVLRQRSYLKFWYQELIETEENALNFPTYRLENIFLWNSSSTRKEPRINYYENFLVNNTTNTNSSYLISRRATWDVNMPLRASCNPLVLIACHSNRWCFA